MKTLICTMTIALGFIGTHAFAAGQTNPCPINDVNAELATLNSDLDALNQQFTDIGNNGGPAEMSKINDDETLRLLALRATYFQSRQNSDPAKLNADCQQIHAEIQQNVSQPLKDVPTVVEQ